MAERRMLIMPSELVRKIDENRGDISQADFIDFLIESHLKGKSEEQKYVTKEELRVFEEDIKKLLRALWNSSSATGLRWAKSRQRVILKN